MTVAPPTRWTELEPDDRRAVLREMVEAALGKHATRATLTIDETAEVLGAGRSTTYAAVHAGALPACRIGRRIVVPVPALVAVLLGVRTSGSDEGSAPDEPTPVNDHRDRPRDVLGRL